MNKSKIKIKQRARRHHRVRAKVQGTKGVPRLSIFRSNRGLYVQLIDDEKSKTLVSASGKEVVRESKIKSPKSKVPEGQAYGAGKSKVIKTKRREIKKKIAKLEQAREVGKLIAKKALKKKIQKIVFDRGGYKYHGRVKAVAEGAREGGLAF